MTRAEEGSQLEWDLSQTSANSNPYQNPRCKILTLLHLNELYESYLPPTVYGFSIVADRRLTMFPDLSVNVQVLSYAESNV